MARYAGSQGKGPKKTKRDKLKASVHVDKPKGEKSAYTDRRVIHRINDGDDGVYHQGRRVGSSQKAKRPNLIRNHTTSGQKSSDSAYEEVYKQYKAKTDKPKPGKVIPSHGTSRKKSKVAPKPKPTPKPKRKDSEHWNKIDIYSKPKKNK